MVWIASSNKPMLSLYPLLGSCQVGPCQVRTYLWLAIDRLELGSHSGHSQHEGRCPHLWQQWIYFPLFPHQIGRQVRKGLLDYSSAKCSDFSLVGTCWLGRKTLLFMCYLVIVVYALHMGRWHHILEFWATWTLLLVYYGHHFLYILDITSCIFWISLLVYSEHHFL